MRSNLLTPRLGVNIDHIATIRNARGEAHPDPVKGALLAEQYGADSITAHLREDRRHIHDEDMRRLKAELKIPLNMEMAATEEMQEIALKINPFAICLVPEKREEVTTEGGLNVISHQSTLTPYIKTLQDNGARVSLFIDPDIRQVDAAIATGARAIELHTGAYALKNGAELQQELALIQSTAKHAAEQGLEVHAGHGLRYDNVSNIAQIIEIQELNIGHFMMGEAIFDGMEAVINKMKSLMKRKNT